jgi:hypothetical protein
MGVKRHFDSRESWLNAATDSLRPHFGSAGHSLPDAIRCAIAFPSTGRRGQRLAECWAADASSDGHNEIIIRADLADPVHVLAILTHELVHAAVPAGSGHGPIYRAAALHVGLKGPMRTALPGPLLQIQLVGLAATLGPFPHAALDFDATADDRPKKRGTYLLKAECSDPACGYTVRITSKWVTELGPPGCPQHGPMLVHLKDEQVPGSGGSVEDTNDGRQ